MAGAVVFTARQVMHTDVLTLDPSMDARTGARMMADKHRGYAVLVKDGKPVGIVTEWDFLEKVLAKGRDPGQLTLADIATPQVQSCDAETPTDQVVEAMASKGIRRMLVTEKGQVVGVITSKDVIRIFREYVNRLSADIARLQIPPIW